MTAKWATIDLPFGGGKAVLAVPHLLEGSVREGLLLRFARLLNSLKVAFGTGEDLGTTPADMHLLATVTPYAVGAHPLTGGLMDPGPFTAGGVLAAIQAALVHRNGSGSLAGRAVLIQGGGDVGAPLARLVAEGGGKLLIADVDPTRAAALAAETGGQVIAPDDVYDTVCDVYAPCAIGGTLNRQTIPRLRCRIVAGSANNQLEEADDAECLRERGVLYAPDFVVNAGGAMAFGLLILGLTDEVELSRRVEGLGKGLGEIFTEAHERGESPLPAARRQVEGGFCTTVGAVFLYAIG